MATPAIRWMESRGLFVKSEFITPGGICDLVGIRFNRKSVARRLKLKQTKPIGSISRAKLLLDIPDVETGEFETIDDLSHRYSRIYSRDDVLQIIDRFIADKFVVRSENGLQKINGWLPLQDRLVAVELKMHRIEEALWQARGNLKFATESYVAFPATVANRISSNLKRWAEFFDQGIGLLAVTPFACRVLVSASIRSSLSGKALQMYCVEKFWRTRSKDNCS